MHARERFHAIMNFEPVDRPLLWEFSYWVATVRRWYKQGLKEIDGVAPELDDGAVVSGEFGGIDWRNPHLAKDVHRELMFDDFLYRLPVNNICDPPFELEIIDEQKNWRHVRDQDGVIVEISKLNGSRHFVDFPVKTRADYEKLREERLKPTLQTRLPPDWPCIRESLRSSQFPVMCGGMQGFLNTPRRYMGFDRLMVAYYDQPGLVKEIINDTVDLLISLYDPVLNEVQADCAMISEDMCYKAGCFVSESMFREFMLPAYQKLTAFYRSHGITTIYVDSDGDVSKLIPLLIEGGVTGLDPFEVTGECDIVAIREQYP